MLDRKKTALVTGANRGIGFEVCRQLAKKGFQVILTSRNSDKGQIAVNTLKEAGLPVMYHQLDVTQSESIVKLTCFLSDEVKQLDVLINNAGIHLDWEDSPDANFFETKIATLRQTMETNVYGCLMLCQTLIPLMKERNYGRVINVSSGSGKLSNMGKIANVPKNSGGFIRDELGNIVWGAHLAYRISKAGMNVLTRILAAELEGTNILVNSVDPGTTITDMSEQNENVHRTPEQAADTIVWLATLADFSFTGYFFKDRKIIPW